ncbi:hypothetical protein, partial [Neisseria gonorrhoeae]|uniref:hypothetical protein n=1 Tax=Neisseria gonorrhoeae TaxID=485 RepID=UPI002409725A
TPPRHPPPRPPPPPPPPPMAQTREYAIIMNGRNQPEVKSSVPYPIKDKDRKRKYTHQNTRGGGGSVSFDNSDELVSQQSGTAVFGTAT